MTIYLLQRNNNTEFATFCEDTHQYSWWCTSKQHALESITNNFDTTHAHLDDVLSSSPGSAIVATYTIQSHPELFI